MLERRADGNELGTKDRVIERGMVAYVTYSYLSMYVCPRHLKLRSSATTSYISYSIAHPASAFNRSIHIFVVVAVGW